MKVKKSVEVSFDFEETCAANTLFQMVCDMDDTAWDALVEESGIADDFFSDFERFIDFIKMHEE